ncbi:PhoH family protein [bacterium]|nr:PhoH family protein [bacterium]
MSGKIFILDTNVLLHNPAALFSFSDNTVVVPITVIEELDKFKGFNDKIGIHARQVLREMDRIFRKGALKGGAKLKNNGYLVIALGNPDLTPPYPLTEISNPDNRILSVAWEYHQRGNEPVFFISKDFNARIKAEALGIQSQDYEKQLVEYSELYRGWREVSVSSDDILSLYQAGKMASKSTLFENEYVVLKAKDSTQTALAKYDKSSNSFVRLTTDLEAMGIRGLNMEQQFAFDLLLNDDIKLVTMIGQAGTGKTLIALACGLQRVIGRHPRYEKLLVARPIVPLGKDIGYLPGTKDQKMNFWMQPIFDNLRFILHKDDGSKESDKNGMSSQSKSRDKIDYLLDAEILEIEAITYIRGRSIPNQFIIIDEAQNLTPHEIKTIVSRVGKGTKIVLTGDPEQIDNPYLDANSNGLSYTAERLKGHRLTGHIFLSKSERSEVASLAADML